jgi:hypothetical protein
MADQDAAPDAAEENKSKFKDIEPLLKWAGVAYAGGFLTVMLHTHSLGVPVMQLIEPIYILVGVPLALAAYFIEPLVVWFKRKRELLRQEMNDIDQALKKLDEIKTPQEAAQEAFKALSNTIDLSNSIWKLVAPFPGGLWTVFTKFVLSRVKKVLDEKLETSDPEKARIFLIKYASSVNLATQSLTAFFRFGLSLVPLALILVILTVYTFYVYPAFPQSLGGGQPIQARLIIDAKKIPIDSANLRDLFPASVHEVKPAGDGTSKPEKPDSKITCNILLHYQTEHAYYISRRSSGPIVVISPEAVNGVIFNPSGDPKETGCN